MQEAGAPLPDWHPQFRCQGRPGRENIPTEDDRHQLHSARPPGYHRAHRGLQVRPCLVAGIRHTMERQAQLQHSIQWKELYSIVLAAVAWGHSWSTLRIRLLCGAWRPVPPTALTSWPSSAVCSSQLPHITLLYLHSTFLAHTTPSLTLSLVFTCRFSTHTPMPHKPLLTQRPSPPHFPSPRHDTLPSALPRHIHPHHIQLRNVQFYYIRTHVQPPAPQRIPCTCLRKDTHAVYHLFNVQTETTVY